MPVYDFKCTECGFIQEEFRTIANRQNSPACTQCSKPTEQIITGGFNNGMKGYPYDDPVLERQIDSPGQKRSLLKELGLEQKC